MTLYTSDYQTPTSKTKQFKIKVCQEKEMSNALTGLDIPLSI